MLPTGGRAAGDSRGYTVHTAPRLDVRHSANSFCCSMPGTATRVGSYVGYGNGAWCAGHAMNEIEKIREGVGTLTIRVYVLATALNGALVLGWLAAESPDSPESVSGPFSVRKSSTAAFFAQKPTRRAKRIIYYQLARSLWYLCWSRSWCIFMLG